MSSKKTKKVAKGAKKVSKPTTKKVAKVAKKISKPTTKKVAKVAKKVSKPTAKKVAKVAKKTNKPTTKKVAKVVKKANKPTTKKVAKVAKKATKPTTKKVVKVAKKVSKPTTKKVAKVAKKTTKPTTKKVVKVAKKVSKPTTKKIVKNETKEMPEKEQSIYVSSNTFVPIIINPSLQNKKVENQNLTKEEIQNIETFLLQKRKELLERIKNKTNEDMPDVEVGDDEADQASVNQSKDILFELNGKAQDVLDQIEAALRRISKGIYGICEYCRKPISKKRILAVPFARYCIHCQVSNESANKK